MASLPQLTQAILDDAYRQAEVVVERNLLEVEGFVIKAYLENAKLKAMSPAERQSFPDYVKLKSFRLSVLASSLTFLRKGEREGKQRPLPPQDKEEVRSRVLEVLGRVAKSPAERQSQVKQRDHGLDGKFIYVIS